MRVEELGGHSSLETCLPAQISARSLSNGGRDALYCYQPRTPLTGFVAELVSCTCSLIWAPLCSSIPERARRTFNSGIIYYPLTSISAAMLKQRGVPAPGLQLIIGEPMAAPQEAGVVQRRSSSGAHRC